MPRAAGAGAPRSDSQTRTWPARDVTLIRAPRCLPPRSQRHSQGAAQREAEAEAALRCPIRNSGKRANGVGQPLLTMIGHRGANAACDAPATATLGSCCTVTVLN